MLAVLFVDMETETQIEALKDVPIARVAAGSLHSLFMTETGNAIYACGCTKNGATGLPKDVIKEHYSRHKVQFAIETPVPVAFPSNGPPLDDIGRFVDISAGEEHSFAVTSNGKLYAWGYGEYRQVGNRASKEVEPQPKLISDEWFEEKGEEVFVHHAAGGSQHSLVLASRFKKTAN